MFITDLQFAPCMLYNIVHENIEFGTYPVSSLHMIDMCQLCHENRTQEKD